MLPLLELRERVKNFYQRYDMYILPVLKFIFALIVFNIINKEIGYDAKLKSLPIVLGVSLLSAFTPSAVMVLLSAVISIFHIYSVSPILSIMIIVILLILYLLFVRYTPKQGYVLLAIPILFRLKIPYMLPILLGLTSTPVAIIPTACGVIIYFLIQIIKTAVTMQTSISVEDILQLYTYVVDSFIGNRQMIMTLVVFSLIILVTYFIRKMSFNYAFEISILAGGIISILGFLISFLLLNKTNQILSMIIGSIVSTGIVYIIHFFRLTLDYSRVEHATFEDDVYYYYVKAVPKATVTLSEVNIRHYNVKGTKRREFSEPDTDDTDHYDYEESEENEDN